MIYIRKIYEDIVQLGGQVATPEMIADGWFEYDGEVPQGTDFKLVNGVLVTYVPEIPVTTQIQIYMDYLTKTDFKMLPGYEPKPGEDLKAIETERNKARTFIRENSVPPVGPITPEPTPIANVEPVVVANTEPVPEVSNISPEPVANN